VTADRSKKQPPRPVSTSPRVLIVITLAEVGGAQSYVAGLLPALARAFDVTVAAWGPGPLRDACRDAGVEFVPLRHVRRPLNPIHDLLGLLELVGLMRRLRPQIVHANSSKAGVLARLAAVLTRVPIRVFTVHGWAFKGHKGLASRFYLLADRLMRPLTTMTICVSESERAAGVAKRTCSPARTIVIRNAVELRYPRPDPENDPPVLLSVGRLKAPKDFRTLLGAAVLLPRGSFKLQIAGDGPERPLLVEAMERLQLDGSVELLGDHSDVEELYRRANVFVLASRSEGMPMSVLEAMSWGLPVVASAVGGVPEVVREGETGMLIEPGQPEALASALERMIADRDLRTRFGAAGRSRAHELFDREFWQEAHVHLYQRLLREHGLLWAPHRETGPAAKPSTAKPSSPPSAADLPV
jgi:glycosyltransferase involved in cell wall biosynthesis